MQVVMRGEKGFRTFQVSDFIDKAVKVTFADIQATGKETTVGRDIGLPKRYR